MTQTDSWTAALGIADAEKLHWQLSESLSPAYKTGHKCSLAAAVELALIENELASQMARGKIIRLPDCPLWKLLNELNATKRERPVKLRDGEILVSSADKRDFEYWNDCLRFLQRELEDNGFQKTIARALTGAVGEMLDNVWIHSEQSRALLAYQVRRRRFAFSVADNGIGVLKSLTNNPTYRHIVSSTEAIKEALEEGVSGKEDGTGLGFSDLLHSLAELWGIVRVRSGEGAVIIDRRTERRQKLFRYVPRLPGLHVSVNCSLDPPVLN